MTKMDYTRKMYQAPLVALIPLKSSTPLCVSLGGQTETFEEFEVPID